MGKFHGPLTPAIYTKLCEPDVLVDSPSSLSDPVYIETSKGLLIAYLRGVQCPQCQRIIVELYAFWPSSDKKPNTTKVERYRVIPKFDLVPELHSSIPDEVKQDYIEARQVKHISLRASATLARRCLQNTLRHAFPEMKTSSGWILSEEITWVENNHRLDPELIQALRALNNAGNFGAHPVKEGGLQTIYELSPKDLDACFSVLEELFLECFIKPAEKKERRERLNLRFPKPEKKRAK